MLHICYICQQKPSRSYKKVVSDHTGFGCAKDKKNRNAMEIALIAKRYELTLFGL